MHMKKNLFLFFLIIVSVVVVSPAEAKQVPVWKPIAPAGYTPLTWVKARGVASFMKAPTGNGYTDYLTIIYLPYDQVQFISSSTPPVVWGPPQPPFGSLDVSSTVATGTPGMVQDWAVSRMAVEGAKVAHPDVQFLWNVPFFNVTASTTDLSLSLRSTSASGTPYTTSGSRPASDMAESRRMLIVNNTKGSGRISDFDESIFTDATAGDQAVEGFSPFTVKTDGPGVPTSRLFLGMKPGGKELVIYCSRSASPQEASDALVAAGVPVENQLQADGGASATCAYNLPGQYFVEPGRTLPYLMGATPIMYRGVVTIAGLSVRNGPGPKHASLRRLAKGTPVVVVQQKNGWVRISGSQEWVSAGYVKKL